VLFAVACFASLDTTVKYLTGSVPIAMAMWFRFSFQAVSTAAMVVPIKGLAGLRTAHPRFQLLRGLLLVTSSALAFTSLRFTSVAEFTAIVSLTPLAITVIAALKLKERVSALRWALVVGGFLGTLLIIRPNSEDFNWALLLPLALVVTSTGFQLLTSHLARTEDPTVTHLYTGLIGMVAASLALPFFWVTLTSAHLWLLLLLLGMLGTVGHFSLIVAYKRANPSVLTPYMYGQIVFAMLGGWLIFSQVPDAWSLAGIALITLCGALGTWLTVRESKPERGAANNRVVPEPIES
jgi:drug/metabolite transporter (DMT)-like permease